MLAQAALAVMSAGLVSQSVAAQQSSDRIEYVSGGLMSPHVELHLDLMSGNYQLTEPKDGVFAPTISREGRLPPNRLIPLRELASRTVTVGFKTAECSRVEAIEKRRTERRRKRGALLVPMPKMDAQLSFWVSVDHRYAYAPFESDCWTPIGKQLYDEMFKILRKDAAFK